MIRFHLLRKEDESMINLIADWYQDQWNIQRVHTIHKLSEISCNDDQFQLILYWNEIPVATAGIYNKVGIHKYEKRFNFFKHWLALVYTVPAYRKKGLASELCKKILHLANEKGIQNIHLYTDTAASMYGKLGWKLKEKINLNNRELAIMEIDLFRPLINE
jgi:predicted acetyltransferase